MKNLVLIVASLIFSSAMAQQSVSIGDTQTKTNAVLYLKGTGTQGLIIPIVTANGTFGESGMLVFNSTDKKLYYNNGTSWVEAGSSGATVSLTAGQNITITGTSPNFTISAPNVDAIVGNEVTQVNTTRGGLEITGTGTTASPLSVGIIQGTVDGQILKWNNTTKKWELGTGGNGSVTSVGLAMPPFLTVTGSPITTSGTLTATLASQTAATVFAAPAAAAGVPAFRTLVATDIPNLDAAKITTGSLPVARGGTGLTTAPTNGQLPIGNGTGYTLAALTAGAGINITNGVGTISIASTGLANPMTTQGDIIFGGASGAATRLAGSTGFLKSTGAFAPTWSAVNLASTDVSGVLPLANGGTGAATAAAARTSLGLGTLATLSTINNADVNAAAAIAGTKIAPNFGSQNIVTTGSLSSNGITSSGAVTLASLAGAGSRLVVANAAGLLSTQTIPASFSTVNVVPKGDGTGLTASQIFDSGTGVGIGTTTPGYLLDVSKVLASPTDAHIRTINTTSGAGTKSGIRFQTGSGWAVHLQTSENGKWLELTNNGGTPVHSWDFTNYYPSNGTAFISGGTSINLMNGNVGVGTATPATQLEVNGFTKLGSESVNATNYTPAIKVRKLIITSPASQGGCSNVAHGIPGNKIINVTAIMEYSTGNYIPSGYTFNAGYQFDWVINPTTTIQICTATGNSASVLSKPVIITITYEE